MTWTTLRTFDTENFTVALQWEPERDPDVSWMDAAGRANLDDGTWTNCTFRVVVLWSGNEIAADYLGNSVYDDPGDFAIEHLGHKHQQGRAYFPDMLRAAVAEARRALSHVPAVRRVA